MRRLLLLVIAGLFLLQGGCGGGGSSSTPPSNNVSTGSNVSGTAAAGIIQSGTVKIYALNADGSRGTLLATTNTDQNGWYSQDLGSYQGPIIALAYGTYLDEATGQSVTLTEDNALRAALPMASGTVSLPITVLTDLAVRKAGGTVTPPSAVANANALVSSIFKVDITATNPVECTDSALSAAGVTQAQRDYTLALAAVSQMASTGTGSTAADKLNGALTTLAQGITTSMDSQTATTFTSAVNTYLNNNSKVNTVITNNGGSAEATVGSQTAVITLSLSGVGSGVQGIGFVLALPAGVTLTSQSDGTLGNAVLGMAQTPGATYSMGHYLPASGGSKATVNVTVGAGGTSAGVAFVDGALLVINANLAAGTVVTADSFALSGITLVNQNGSPVAGTLTVSGVKLQ